MRRARSLAAAGAAVLIVFQSGCGGNTDVAATQPAPSVPTALVPRTLYGGKLAVAEVPSAAKRFARTKGSTLAADAKLWAIRQMDTLVATLQIATLVGKVDLSRRSDRQQIVSSVLAGGTETIDVQGISVHTLVTEDRVVFLWFGRRLFEVLQIKATKVDPERLLSELLEYQGASPSWEPLEADENERDEDGEG